ncbi:MAG: bacillithiol biosynthesis deacetylase BshB1 [Candidatus Eisenbacteria bacterium]
MRVVAVGAHPDDIELSCGGLVARLTSIGHEVGIIDLTYGEMASSGDRRIRIRESLKAAGILGVAWRECLGLPDTGLDHSERLQIRAVVEALRKHKPSFVLAPHRASSHPDHMEAGEMLRRAMFLAGLRRFEARGRPHRSSGLLYYMGDLRFEPSIVVDVTRFHRKKMSAVKAYRSQFRRDSGDSYPTRLNAPGFLELIEERARYLGGIIGTDYAEGFLHEGPLRVGDPAALLCNGRA